MFDFMAMSLLFRYENFYITCLISEFLSLLWIVYAITKTLSDSAGEGVVQASQCNTDLSVKAFFVKV